MLVISWDICPTNVLIVLSCKDTVLPAIYCKYEALQLKQREYKLLIMLLVFTAGLKCI